MVRLRGHGAGKLSELIAFGYSHREEVYSLMPNGLFSLVLKGLEGYLFLA